MTTSSDVARYRRGRAPATAFVNGLPPREHRLGERAVRGLGTPLQRRRRPSAASLPHRRPRLARRAARARVVATGRLGLGSPPDRGPRVELGRDDDAPVRLEGRAPPGARRVPGGVLGAAASRQHRPSDAVGLADRPRGAARAHRRAGRRPLRHRRVPDDAGPGAGAPHDVAGEHAAAPAGRLLPRPGLGGLPARRDPVAGRLPGGGARPGLLRLPAGAVGRPAPRARRHARVRRADRDVRQKGFDAVEIDDIDSFNPPSTTGFQLTRGDVQNLLARVDNAHPPSRHDRPVEELGPPRLVGPPLHRRRGRRGVLPVRRVLLRPARREPAVRVRVHRPWWGDPCGYDAFTSQGKWVGEAEYREDGFVCGPGQTCGPRHRFSTYCNRVYAPPNGFAAVKFDVDLDGALFRPCPSGR